MPQKMQSAVSTESSRTTPDIDIEPLALDPTSCARCVGTLDNTEKAIETVRPAAEAAGQASASHSCCEPSEQATCCLPQAKAECCGPPTEEAACGCR